MTGYQEALTDPSFAEQILVMTYPLQGNYGINEYDVESRRIQVRAFVVREDCDDAEPLALEGHAARSTSRDNDIPGIAGVDTRALTRKLRTGGVMMGTVTHDETAEQALARLRDLPRYGSHRPRAVGEHAPAVRLSRTATSAAGRPQDRRARPRREVQHPAHAAPPRLRADGRAVPDDRGGHPGDEARRRAALARPRRPRAARLRRRRRRRGLVGKTPLMGICLGHQVLGAVFGAQSFKLKFGHRGANHPVRDEATGRVYITAQNHGYAVDDDGLSADVEVSHAT